MKPHLVIAILGMVCACGSGQAPCRSGLPAGARPGPYSQVVVTGPYRGTSFCFVCDTGDKPVAIVFARGPSKSLGKLASAIDNVVCKSKAADMRGWVTFLHKDQSAVDAALLQWAQEHVIKTVPLGVFEDEGGPPSYKLTREAEVTVLLAVEQKVVANFAFREGELTDARIDEVIKAASDLLTKK